MKKLEAGFATALLTIGMSLALGGGNALVSYLNGTSSEWIPGLFSAAVGLVMIFGSIYAISNGIAGAVAEKLKK